MIDRKSWTSGVIGGGIIILYYLLVYFWRKEFLFDSVLVLFPMVVYAGFMATRARQCAAVTSPLSFKHIFSNTWICGAIIMLIASVFQHILYGLIDPSLQEMLIDKTREALSSNVNILGEEKLEEALENLESQDLFSLKTFVSSVLIGFVFPIAVLALLIAGLVYAFAKNRINTNSPN